MNDFKSPSNRNFQSGVVMTRQLWLLAGAAVLLLALAYWYFGINSDSAGKPVPAPPTSKQAVPEIAREVISEQQEEEAPDYPAALEQARSLRAEGKLADAQLLYFFAARGGYAPAALELAEQYDPLYFDAGTSLMDKPDAFQAFKWYQAALEGGETTAALRLEELQSWAQEAADEGDMDAEQLLLQWN
jgi:hypothetical protein